MIFDHFKRSVTLIGKSGGEYQVKMLPVSLLDRFCEITDNVTDGNLSDALPRARHMLREMAMMVCPAELEGDLLRMDYVDMVKVVSFLFYGDQSSRKVDNANDKKMPDFHFLAARVMANFPGYTLETLLSEPVPVFMKLVEMVTRVQADRALNEQTPAIAAALNGGKAINALERAVGDRYVDDTHNDLYDAKALEKAERALKTKGKSIKSVKLGDVVYEK